MTIARTRTLAILNIAAVMLMTAPALGVTFTYQGRLTDNNAPANGVYDFQFRLFSAEFPFGFIQGSPVNVDDLNVVDGLFTVKLNFANVSPLAGRWLDISVRPGASSGSYTILAPRTELTPAPLATGLELPYSVSTSSTQPIFILDQTGTGKGLQVDSDAGNAISAYTSAGGIALFGQSTGGGIPIYGYNIGTSGNAGVFKNESISNPAAAVDAQTNGSGPAVHALSNTGYAGQFQSTSANATPAVICTKPGGPALHVVSSLSAPGTPATDAALAVVGGSDTAPSGGGFIVCGSVTGQNISIDNNEIMGRNNGSISPLFLNVDGGAVVIGRNSAPAGAALAVKGKVLCEELEVQLSADWPDYVFEDDYRLMSLEETDEFILANGHLPGVPSAAEIKKQGVSVGVMQAKLLEKVEELTLHMIDMDRELARVQHENELLLKQVETQAAAR